MLYLFFNRCKKAYSKIAILNNPYWKTYGIDAGTGKRVKLMFVLILFIYTASEVSLA
jgi:hypothetical protein